MTVKGRHLAYKYKGLVLFTLPLMVSTVYGTKDLGQKINKRQGVEIRIPGKLSHMEVIKSPPENYLWCARVGSRGVSPSVSPPRPVPNFQAWRERSDYSSASNQFHTERLARISGHMRPRT